MYANAMYLIGSQLHFNTSINNSHKKAFSECFKGCDPRIFLGTRPQTPIFALFAQLSASTFKSLWSQFLFCQPYLSSELLLYFSFLFDSCEPYRPYHSQFEQCMLNICLLYLLGQQSLQYKKINHVHRQDACPCFIQSFVLKVSV